MPRQCIPMDLPGGGRALVTVSVPPKRPCAFCGTPTHALCDFPLVGKNKNRTCSKRICERCYTELAPDVQLCPVHAYFVREYGIEQQLGELLAQKDGIPIALDLVLRYATAAGDALPIAEKSRMTRVQWIETFIERAAIMEYEGGLSRELANKYAHQEIASLYGAMPVAQ